MTRVELHRAVEGPTIASPIIFPEAPRHETSRHPRGYSTFYRNY
jgi:hypothetical protein